MYVFISVLKYLGYYLDIYNQDNYRIINFESPELLSGDAPLKNPPHAYHPSDRFLRMHFERCLTVSAYGGDSGEGASGNLHFFHRASCFPTLPQVFAGGTSVESLCCALRYNLQLYLHFLILCISKPWKCMLVVTILDCRWHFVHTLRTKKVRIGL
jgi:hypothetical protein